MKKTLKRILTAALSAVLLLVTFSLAGCSGNQAGENAPSEPINLTVVLGITQNAPDPELSLLNDYLETLAAHGGHLTAIVDDGDPKGNFKELDLKAPNSNKSANYQKKQVQANAASAAKVVSSMKALTPETNTLAALKLAADNTPAAEEGRKNVLIIFDNGIQTMKGNSSAFTMTDLRTISVKCDDVLENIKQTKSIPDLSKFSEIEWYGVGETVGKEQKEPPNCDVEALKAYYTKILSTGGVTDAGSVFKDHIYKPSSSDHSTMPEVSTVKVTTIKPVQPPDFEEDTSSDSENTRIIGEDEVLHIENDKIRFKPDSTELADQKAAKAVLYGLIGKMKKLEGKIVIIGTTASVGNKSTAVTFSKKRAEAIKKLIVSDGISSDRILVYGAGFSDDRLVQDDLDKNGNLDERIAPYNRAVNILDVDNDIAQSYINGTFKP